MSKQGLSPEEQLKQLEAQLKAYKTERDNLEIKAARLKGKIGQGESFPKSYEYQPSGSRNRPYPTTEPYSRARNDPEFRAKYTEISTKIKKLESEKIALQLKIYEESKLQFITKVDSSSQGITLAISCLMGKIRLFPFSEKELPEISSDCVVGHYGLVEFSDKGEKKYFLMLKFCYFVNDEEEKKNLREHLVNENQLQLYALDIARGLNYLHIKRIAYKNLCLQNVLIHGSRVKLEHPAVVGSKMRNAEKSEIAEDLRQYGKLLEEALEVKRGEKSINSDQPLRYLIERIKHNTITTLSDVISFLEERQPAEGANHFIDVSLLKMSNDREVPCSTTSKKRKAAGTLMTYSKSIPWLTLSELQMQQLPEDPASFETDYFGMATVRPLPATTIQDQINDYDSLTREAQSQFAFALRQTEREFTISDDVQHNPHILKVCAFIGDENKEKYPQGIVLEYAPGGNILDYLKKQGKPDNNMAYSWALQLARTMHTLHYRHKIMHRDLRSENIFVFESGNLIKLGNFGYGKKITGNTAVEMSCRNDLNIVYCAPEIISDDQAFSEQTFSADVWSFGMFLYEITHNKQPFSGKKYGGFALRKSIESGVRPELDGSVHPVFLNLMEKCWVLESPFGASSRPTFSDIVKELKDARSQFQVLSVP